MTTEPVCVVRVPRIRELARAVGSLGRSDQLMWRIRAAVSEQIHSWRNRGARGRTLTYSTLRPVLRKALELAGVGAPEGQTDATRSSAAKMSWMGALMSGKTCFTMSAPCARYRARARLRGARLADHEARHRAGYAGVEVARVEALEAGASQSMFASGEVVCGGQRVLRSRGSKRCPSPKARSTPPLRRGCGTTARPVCDCQSLRAAGSA
jgi:hypothetical protein